ncbi:hypothetical protein [Desulfonema ishimotonii]|nr:hypothetical protein [Desulfonema ishimotonii]
MMFEGYDPEIFSHSQAGNVSGHHSSEKPISPKASSESDGLSQLPASYPGEENQKKFRADRLVYEEDDSPPPSGLTYLFKAIDLSQRFLAWTHSFLFSWQSSSDANQFSETD